MLDSDTINWALEEIRYNIWFFESEVENTDYGENELKQCNLYLSKYKIMEEDFINLVDEQNSKEK